MPVTAPKTVTLSSHEFQPAIGSYVIPEGKIIGEVLMAGDDRVDSGYPGCQFRWPVNNGGPIKSVAVNVEITGRTIQHPFGQRQGQFTRVKMEWVGDCEPSTFSYGWMFIR